MDKPSPRQLLGCASPFATRSPLKPGRRANHNIGHRSRHKGTPSSPRTFKYAIKAPGHYIWRVVLPINFLTKPLSSAVIPLIASRMKLVRPDQNLYGYDVNAGVAIMFIVLFSLSGLAHLGQAIYYRIWWLVPTMVFCALAELLGWAGRYWSSQNYRALTPFLMQICCTIMAPSFMAAGMFFILGMIVNRVGQEYSRLRPKVFSIVFISFDFFSLVVQAIGGGAASSSFQKGKSATKGTNIMVTGIFIQLVAISLAVVVAIEFLIRYLWDKPLRARTTPERTLMGHNEKLMLSGLAIATMWLYIRTIYRTIELLGGWQGAVIHNQAAFDCLDAMPVIIALVTLSILSPGRLLSAPKLDRQSINNEGVPMHHVAMGKSIGDLK